MKRHLSLLLAATLLVCAPAIAETYRVNPSKARQLPQILANLHDGDTVIFERGTYSTQNGLEIARVNNITLQGEGKAEIVLGNLNDAVLTVNNCTRIRVSGLRARHENPNREYACEGAVIEVRDSSQIAVSECELNGCGAAGVYATGCQDLVIANNTIFNNSYAAVWLYDSSALVHSNRITRNATELVTGGTCEVTMVENKTENNKGNDWLHTEWTREVLKED